MAQVEHIGKPQGGRVPLKSSTVHLAISRAEQRQLKGGVREFTAYIIDVLIRKPKLATPDPDDNFGDPELVAQGSSTARRKTRKLKAPPVTGKPRADSGNTGLEPEMMVTELDTEELVHLSVAKRYSEFLAFHKSWTHKYPKLGKQGFVMPRKKWFNNMSEEFINQRRIALETYLQQCKRVAALVPELFRWLEISHIVPRMVEEAENKTDQLRQSKNKARSKKREAKREQRAGGKINPAQLTRRRTRENLMAAVMPSQRKSLTGTMVPVGDNAVATSPSTTQRRIGDRRGSSEAEARSALSTDEHKNIDAAVAHAVARVEHNRSEESKGKPHDVHMEFAMLRAVTSGDLQSVKGLIESGVPVNTPLGYLGETPLMWAVNRQQNSIVRYLLSKGAKVIEPYREHINAPVGTELGFAPLPFVTLESDEDSYSDYTDSDYSTTDEERSDTELR